MRPFGGSGGSDGRAERRMKHSVRQTPGSVIVSFDGEIDLESSPAVRDALLASVGSASRGRVLVDLAAVPYIDSSGIASLVEAYQKARQTGVGFGLATVRPAVLRVLQLSRLDKIFPIHASIEEGLKS